MVGLFFFSRRLRRLTRNLLWFLFLADYADFVSEHLISAPSALSARGNELKLSTPY